MEWRDCNSLNRAQDEFGDEMKLVRGVFIYIQLCIFGVYLLSMLAALSQLVRSHGNTLQYSGHEPRTHVPYRQRRQRMLDPTKCINSIVMALYLHANYSVYVFCLLLYCSLKWILPQHDAAIKGIAPGLVQHFIDYLGHVCTVVP